MKKFIKYSMSFYFIFMLFPVSVFAGETVYETSCGLSTWFDEMVIRPTRISGSFSLDDFGEDGNIGVDALVEGNGNQARFSNIVEYEKIGNRLELEKDDIKTNVTKEQFQEHFGLFPTVTCSAG